MSETIKEETAEAVQAEPQGLTLEKFEEATEVVSKVISETKLVYSEYFSNLTGNKVYLKPENMQYTGAYKVRGAFYKISTRSMRETARLITASAGNYAQGVAYAAKTVAAAGNGYTRRLPREVNRQKLWRRGGSSRRCIR
ncbi:MAG: pyridoxal-phosphate dependent enzyme [Clostridium fessum]